MTHEELAEAGERAWEAVLQHRAEPERGALLDYIRFVSAWFGGRYPVELIACRDELYAHLDREEGRPVRPRRGFI